MNGRRPMTVPRISILAGAAGILGAASLSAQSPFPAARVDSVVAAEMSRTRVPGVAVAVVQNGEVVLARGYGLANVEHQVPVKPETIFQSGSVGKQFTAMAILMLAEEGRLGVADSITRYLEDAPGAWKGITIRHLLTHTGGTTDYPDDFDFRLDYTEDDLLRRAYAIPLAFRPGERWDYSNLGYVLLGIIIRRVSGQFYGDFLQERVFRPLGMATARVISEADIVANRAAGYVLKDGVLRNQEWVSPSVNTTADGALYLTVLDLAKWEAALHHRRLIGPASYDQLWSPVALNDGTTAGYGFGWRIGTRDGERVIEHGGSWQGFTSAIVRYEDRGLTVIVLDNLAGVDASGIAHRVAALLH